MGPINMGQTHKWGARRDGTRKCDPHLWGRRTPTPPIQPSPTSVGQPHTHPMGLLPAGSVGLETPRGGGAGVREGQRPLSVGQKGEMWGSAP